MCCGHETMHLLIAVLLMPVVHACSRPVDVLNWERALFTDSNSVYLTHVAPALTAALPPSALNAILSPFRRGTPGT